MISEFQDLSDKISRLAEMTESLRRENASLRQSNKELSELNMTYVRRLIEAQQRVEGLLAQLPAPAQDSATDEAEATE
jgi:predicted RNase H-like nuclease (RuvC/YqgF family)